MLFTVEIVDVAVLVSAPFGLGWAFFLVSSVAYHDAVCFLAECDGLPGVVS